MRKVLFLIILFLFLPINVFAENILDNYSLDIYIDGYYVKVTEKFDVISTDEDLNNNFSRRIFGDIKQLDVINTNVLDYKLLNEDDEDNYFIGNIENNNSYTIIYTNSDYSEYGVHAYTFYVPDDTKIKKFNFKIIYSSNVSSVNVYGYDNSYVIKKNNHLVTGNLIDSDSISDFSINSYVKVKKDVYNNTRDNDFGYFFLGSIKFSVISILVLLFIIISGILLLKLKYKCKKTLLILYVVVSVSFIALQYIFNPFIDALFILVYSLFYSLLFVDRLYEENIAKIFTLLFLTLHSYLFFGFELGIIPHIINNISIYIISIYFNKLKDMDIKK